MKKLKELFDIDSEIEIDGIMQDSRKPVPNAIFFAQVGMVFDGHNAISQAITNGAICIVHSNDIVKHPNIVYIKVADVVGTLNEISAKFYDYPSREMFVMGVSGTNGKSTIAYLCYDLFKRLKRHPGYIGTISVEYNNHKIKSNLTTPEISDLHRIISDMKKEGVDTLCMEMSSQGLVLRRTEAIKCNVAIFSNLSHDHLDFHKTMENYKNAKLLLFKSLAQDSTAIINLDDKYAQDFIKASKCHVYTYSILNPAADLYGFNMKMSFAQTTFEMYFKNKKYKIATNILANYNISNLLSALACVYSAGYAMEDIIKQVNDISPIAGRLQVFKAGQPFNVVVDYAHTPDAMEKVLSFMKSITLNNGRLIICFGSAGDRDVTKRPLMGEVADKYGDLIVLCEDDNRHESPLKIAREISSGIKKTRCEFIRNRQVAIKYVLDMAQPNDTVCVLGKGNDAYMAREYVKDYYPGDDNVVANFLKEMYPNTLN